MSAKKNAWWAVPVVTLSITGAGYWITDVNAYKDKTIRHETILPLISEQLTEIKVEQKEMRQEMNQRFSEIRRK